MSDNSLKSSTMLVTSNQYIEKLKKFSESVQIEFTDYQKMCVVNGVRAINKALMVGNYTWDAFLVDNVVDVLQQTAFLNLNPSAVPHECCYTIRKTYDSNHKPLPPTIEFGIEGAGNDVILQKYGRDVVDVKSYIVYDGDEFTVGSFDGWNVVLPTYRRMFKSNKPMKAVYLIKKKNGEIDVQYSDLDDVKKSLLANAKQNGADEKLLRELNKLSLYELLETDKWLDYKIEKEYGGKKYFTPLFNPSYTSPISMANMIERKLKNHATRKYPKDFNNKAVSELYEKTFEDKQLAIEPVTPEQRIEGANGEFETESGKDTIEKKDDVRPKLNVVVEPVQETQKEPEQVLEEPLKDETIVIEPEKETTVGDGDKNDPDHWDD